MAYGSFEDLEVGKKSCDLAVSVYQALMNCRDYGFKDQICRSAVSIPSNIAEGMERDSCKDRIHFQYIAKGSCAELRTQLIIAERIGFQLLRALGDRPSVFLACSTASSSLSKKA